MFAQKRGSGPPAGDVGWSCAAGKEKRNGAGKIGDTMGAHRHKLESDGENWSAAYKSHTETTCAVTRGTWLPSGL